MSTRQPVIEGLTAATVGVTDFGPHLDFFCGQLGYAQAGNGVVPAATTAALWGADNEPGPGEAEVVVLSAAGAGTGRINLVRVPGAEVADWPHNLDDGLIGIDMYARDIVAAHAAMAAAGTPWHRPPATYGVPFGERTVEVTQGVCPGPGGVVTVFVQPAAVRDTAAWAADPSRMFTELTSVVCHVPDPDGEVRLWGPDGLGMSVWYDVTFTAPGFDEVADLPPGTRMRLAFLAGPATARIEVTCAEGPHRADLRPRQRPGRGLGHCGWSVRTGDLDEALRRAAQAGARHVGEAVRTDD
ncbi:MAG: VOC family protein, partial [Trebonia sp.]